MMHTGDNYERRARVARHRDLRALVQAVAGLFHASAPSRSVHRKKPANDAGLPGIGTKKHDRAA